MPRGSGLHLPDEEGSGAVTCPVGLYMPLESRIKKGIAGPAMQLAPRVPKMHTLDSAAVAIKASAFSMRTCLTSAAATIKVCKTCRQMTIVQHRPF
jgi:hypothetical protein